MFELFLRVDIWSHFCWVGSLFYSFCWHNRPFPNVVLARERFYVLALCDSCRSLVKEQFCVSAGSTDAWRWARKKV